MLAVVRASRGQLDAGSIGLALARRWSAEGDQVLLIDADVSGSRLSERLGMELRAEFSPAVRGMPSLMVARSQLTLHLLAEHCYSLDTPAGSLWALFAPHSQVGAGLAADWLSERIVDLMAVDKERSIITTLAMDEGALALTPVLQASHAVAVIAPVPSVDAARMLRASCRDAGLLGFERNHRLLIAEGDCPLDADAILLETGLHFAGSLSMIDDSRVLRSQGGRKERAFASQLDEIAARIAALMHIYAAEADHLARLQPPAAHETNGVAGVANGAAPSAEPVAGGSERPRQDRLADVQAAFEGIG